MTLTDHIQETTAFLRDRQPEYWQPQAALILGSGLNQISTAMQDAVVIDYDEIPHFLRTQVEGHSGKLHMGWLGGAPTICFQGRQHLYEGPRQGIDAWTVALRAIRALGVDILFLTAAAGSLNKTMTPGSITPAIQVVSIWCC